MGQRGPKPSPGSVTRHKPKQRSRLLTGAPVKIPELVGTYLPQTWAWWDTWINSPQVEFLSATDWQTLLRLVPLVDAYFMAPTAQLASEIRQTEAKLGATASDRDRLGWRIEPPKPDAGDGAGERPRGSRSRPDPRAGGAA